MTRCLLKINELKSCDFWMLGEREQAAAPAAQREPGKDDRMISSNVDLTCIYGRKIS